MSEPDRSSDPLAELLASAIEAEQQTGHREETVPAAERHLVVRIVRVTLGAVIVCIGLSLMVLPGPGLIVTAAGLALMAPDIPFARALAAGRSAPAPRGRERFCGGVGDRGVDLHLPVQRGRLDLVDLHPLIVRRSVGSGVGTNQRSGLLTIRDRSS